MSEHTKGRLVVKGEWLIPEAHADRMIGSSTNKADDKSNYAHNVAIVRGKYQDDKANARRLTAAWNACDGVSPPLLDCIADNGGVLLMLSEASRQERELNAARALLREVMDQGGCVDLKLDDRIYDYLDACDKPGEAT